MIKDIEEKTYFVKKMIDVSIKIVLFGLLPTLILIYGLLTVFTMGD